MKNRHLRRVGAQLISATLILALALALCACGSKAPAEPTPAPVTIPEAAPVTIPEAAPEATPEVTPEPAPVEAVPEAYGIELDLVAPVCFAAPDNTYSLSINGTAADAACFQWLKAAGSINDPAAPDAVFKAAEECFTDGKFAVPADYSAKDITLSDGVSKFEENSTYLAVFVFELPGLSDTELLTLTVVPACTSSFCAYEAEYTVCDNTCLAIVRFDLAAHEHTWTLYDMKSPTCTEAGYSDFRCTCGAQYVRDEAALGHNWGPWIDNHDYKTHTRTCGRCGLTETGEHNMVLYPHTLGHWYCTFCGYEYQVIN